MAKPRIFVSSTYIDLKHTRRHIEAFIKQMGYESVLFESGDIPFHFDQPLDISCYGEIETCHMLILIIGGKYGSATSEQEDTGDTQTNNEKIAFYNSITKKEYITAREKNIPIFIFVEKGVFSEYETFKKNRMNSTISYAHVDNVNIFKLLDDIISQRNNNYVKGFENFDDITTWLKEQWAGIFADFLSKKSTDINIKNLQQQIVELKEITGSLKVYNEALLKSTNVQGGDELIKREDEKLKFSKALRFKKHPLIEYLLDRKELKISAIRLLQYFSETTDLKSFTKKLGWTLKEFSELGPLATVDYLKLRNELLDENNELPNYDSESDQLIFETK